MVLNMPNTLISICIPVYNEEDNIEPLHQRLSNVLKEESNYEFEIVFTDNHSEDETFARLTQLAEKDKRVRVIRFSRNFGYQASIMTNYLHARGQAAIQLDCDLQDPPELISTFLRKWEEGYKVVYGVRLARPEPWWLLATRRFYYRFLDFISEDHLPPDAGDFRLIDRRVIELLRGNTDAQPYLRGLIAAMGFNQIGIPYNRDARLAGKSKFNFSRLLALGMDGILQHSTVPLRIASIVGVITCLFAIFISVYYFFTRLFFPESWPPGLASNNILLLFSIGMNAIFLGIIGEYLGRIYKNMRKAPLTIIEHTIDYFKTPEG
jgi:dolichol-phosphate mannosyltransferase